jgi:hypothetical protein
LVKRKERTASKVPRNESFTSQKKKKKKNDAGRAELLFAQISRLQGFACFFNKTNKKWLAYCPSPSMSLKPHHGHVK